MRGPRSARVSVLLVGAIAMLLAGCAQTSPPATPSGSDAPAVETEESGAHSPDTASPDPVEVLLPDDAACIFSPEELTAQYAGYTDYVAGAAEPDTENDGPGSCVYPHADPALQYVAAPFSIWVTAYSYDDAYIGYRVGADTLTDESGLALPGTTIDRSTLWDLRCSSNASAICEDTPEAGIVVLDNYSAWVFRDDVVWEIEASGITSGNDPDEMGSLLNLARLAAGRSV